MANILVLIPTSNKLPLALERHCRFLARRLKRANPSHKIEIVFDSRGSGWNNEPKNHDDLTQFVNQIAPIRQAMIDEYLKPQHDYVFWVDADLVSYPANLLTEFIKRNPFGISAPMVFLEGHGRRFFDLAGFVENGRWCQDLPPFFKQPGPIYDLDGVGCIYLVPADLYRQGAKYVATRGFTEHYSVCNFARRRLLPIRAFDDLIAVHYFYELWNFNDRQELFQKIQQWLTLRLISYGLIHKTIKKKLTKEKKVKIFLEAWLLRQVANPVIDKFKKIIFVLINYPACIIRSPFLINRFISILIKDGTYKAFQNAYDYLQLVRMRSVNSSVIATNNNLPAVDYSNVFRGQFDSFKINILKQQFKYLKNIPKISVVIAVYDVDLIDLKATLESVKKQIYSNWELCLANGSQKMEIIDCLDAYAKDNEKIKLIHLPNNKGISGNANEALTLATGQYIALMDHDDELTIDALLEVAKIINRKPEAEIIYSDEDKIDLAGNYCDYNFKPDWCPDLLLGSCYFGHLTVIKKNIIDLVGFLRPQFDGSQDHDLFLRATEVTKNIFHIPKVLYHWRMTPTSTALTIDNKPYCYQKSILAIEDALKRRKISAHVIANSRFGGPVYVRYETLKDGFVSIIIPTKDQPWLLEKLVNSILDLTGYKNFEIIVVNNNSKTQETKDCFSRLTRLSEKIRVIDYNFDFNYSAINNFAVNYAAGNTLLFLNDDMEVIDSDWLLALVEQVERPEVGVVGAKLVYPNNVIQHAGVIVCPADVLHAFQWHTNDCPHIDYANSIRNYNAVTGACLMMRKTVFIEVGGFDEGYQVIYSDIDICLKSRVKGYLVVYTPLAKLRHLESATRGLLTYPADTLFFRNKWEKYINQNDIYYNVNLSREPGQSFYWCGHLEIHKESDVNIDCASLKTWKTSISVDGLHSVVSEIEDYAKSLFIEFETVGYDEVCSKLDNNY